MEGWMNGWMDRWMDGWMDGELVFVFENSCSSREARTELIFEQMLE